MSTLDAGRICLTKFAWMNIQTSENRPQVTIAISRFAMSERRIVVRRSRIQRRCRVRSRNYTVAGTEVRRDALQFGDVDDDVLSCARLVGRVRHREFQDLHARRGPSGVRRKRRQENERE